MSRDTDPAPSSGRDPSAPPEGAPSTEKRADSDAAADAAGPPSAAAKPLLPLFKIRPVDPKNAFNFEDVADK